MNMKNRQSIVSVARSYIGTPYSHQGRFPGLALDCAGLVVCAALECGFDVSDVAGYSPTPDGVTFLAGIESQMDKIEISEVLPGDVLAFTFVVDPQHAAIVTEIGDQIRIVHAHMSARKAVEHGLDEKWVKRICAAFRFRGIE